MHYIETNDFVTFAVNYIEDSAEDEVLVLVHGKVREGLATPVGVDGIVTSIQCARQFTLQLESTVHGKPPRQFVRALGP